MPFFLFFFMLKAKTAVLIAALLFLATIPLYAKDWLHDCWTKQVNPLKNNILAMNYRESVNELEHNLAPWQVTAYVARGTVWSGAKSYSKQDTLYSAPKQRTYFSITQRTTSNLLYQDYGEKKLAAATPGMHMDYIFQSARYSPVALLTYFKEHGVSLDKESTATMALYHTTINQTVVRLAIRKRDSLLAQVEMLSDDVLLGDISSSYTYEDYKQQDGIYYPVAIRVTKVNGKAQDQVTILASRIQTEAPVLLTPPPGYLLKPLPKLEPLIQVVHYSSRIHFLELKHTDDRVLIVEFDQFMLVAEAPLNSQNGELIIREAKKIAPSKPIRYFVAGHHHPHYVGGVRPFVHRGSTILFGKDMGEYVRYLVAAPHTLHPDSLQLKPRQLHTEEIRDKKVISDGPFEMQIFCIGKKSAHTNNYLIYYFPAEKLLFQDDSAWIPKQGSIGKASDRQAALYHAIKDLGLNVDTVVQSWPVADYGVKTMIPFVDLEQSMK